MRFTVEIPDENVTHNVPAELEDKLDIKGRDSPLEELNKLLKLVD